MSMLVPTDPNVDPLAHEPPRRRWRMDEIERMIAAGILGADEPLELVQGELVAMAPKNRRHEVLRDQLSDVWARRLPADVKMISETTLRLSPEDNPEPDFLLYPASLKAPDVRGRDVLLVVECSDTSLGYDLGVKSHVYAVHGIREYWVMNANTHAVTVHLDPRAAGYANVATYSRRQHLVPHLAPDLAVRLADLDLE